MLSFAADYSSLYGSFRWQVPARYNMGTDVCDRWAAGEPDRLAILHRIGDGNYERITYGELRRQSDRLALALRTLGVGPGHRVALYLPQRPETALAHIAVWKLGAISVPMALLFGPDALAYRLADSGAHTLVTTEAGLATFRRIETPLPALDHVVCVDGPSAGAEDFHRLVAEATGDFTPVSTGADDPAVMIYTSGTTGNPKGALHAHRVLLGHLPGVQTSHEFLPRDGDLLWTPADWAWIGGLFDVLMPGLHFGVPVLACRFDKFDPEAAFEVMAEARVRNTFLPPTALKMLRTLEAPRARFGIDLRTVGSGGESLGIETLEWGRRELGVTINEFYGQTECNYVLSSCNAIGVGRPGAIGKPVPGHRVEVIDPDGNVLPPGELGEIAVARPDPVMFLGYWNRPEATAAKFVGDWLKTGDQGVRDADGYISFVGRDDDVITSAGYRIGPGEIEDCLLTHPAVALAAAVGKPDALRTEIVKAFVVLKEGVDGSAELGKEIGAHVKSRLAAHEYPREIEFVDSLPMTTTGKVMRRVLRDRG
ncbi:MAG TPA: acyl-CoA synthetase [Kaistiaceae bacterium]|nr:acyl-CoA synthetase [Kaistiaceae bacterium]